MALKFVLLISVVGIVAAVELQHAYHHKSHEIEEGPAEYEFSYSVHDKHTGDIKAQKEVRKGDKVEGVYELIDSDGHRRIVHYRADKHSGFEAVVHREPTGIKIPIPEPKHKIITPLVHHHSIEPLHSLSLGSSEGISSSHHVQYSGLGHSHRY